MQAEFQNALDIATANAARALADLQTQAQLLLASLQEAIESGAIQDDVEAAVVQFQASAEEALANAKTLLSEAQQELNELKAAVKQAIENASVSVSRSFNLESNLVDITANFSNEKGLYVQVDWNSEEVSMEDTSMSFNRPVISTTTESPARNLQDSETADHQLSEPLIV
jgi:hypothetical protein